VDCGKDASRVGIDTTMAFSGIGIEGSVLAVVGRRVECENGQS